MMIALNKGEIHKTTSFYHETKDRCTNERYTKKLGTLSLALTNLSWNMPP
jgi:hypothetical protein